MSDCGRNLLEAADSRVRTITDTTAEIRTRRGLIPPWRCHGRNDGKPRTITPKHGLVLSVFTSGRPRSVPHSANRGDAEWKQTVRFYYPNADGGGVEYADKEIAFRTNDVTRTVLSGLSGDGAARARSSPTIRG